MNIQDMQNLLVFFQEGSLSKAAKKLYITQPALSQTIKKIEKEYNISLFSHAPGEHKIEFTQEGLIFRDFLQETVQNHNTLTIKLHEFKEKDQSIIYMGISPRMSAQLSPKLLRWFSDNHPEYYLRIREEQSDQMEKDLKDGNLDYAFFSLRGNADTRLAYEVIQKEHWMIYLRRNSPAEKKAVIRNDCPYAVLSLQDIAYEPIASPGPDTRGAQLIADMEKKAGVTLKKRIENNPLNRLQLADQGLRTTFVRRMDKILFTYDTSRLYLIDEKDEIPVQRCICYSPEIQDPQKTEIVCQCFRDIINE